MQPNFRAFELKAEVRGLNFLMKGPSAEGVAL